MGKVCSKAHGLTYVDDDNFIGARLGPEGECRSSVDSVSQSDCDAELKMKTDSSRYQDKCLNDWKKHEKEKTLDGNIAINKATHENVKLFDDCNLIVELPPESQKPEESSPTREDHIATKFRYGGTQSVIPHYKSKEVAKSVDEPSKANQDEWSYTVYDIDGGSKVTNQDLSHVMHSIQTTIGQSADQSICTNANDNKILKIKVAVGPKEGDQPKVKTKRHKEFSRMILPPPGSEEAEMLCYYIREKLLTFVNQEEALDREVCRERKRGRRRGGSSGRSSQSPEVACEVDNKTAHSVKGNKEFMLGKETSFATDSTTNAVQQRKHCSSESHQDDVNRPFYGLPQRQDTYGGPVDSPLRQCASLARKRSDCSPSSGSRSPPDSCIGLRGWPDLCSSGSGNQRCISETSTKLSSFLHKDAYREVRKDGSQEVRKDDSPRKCKKLSRREQLSSCKNETFLTTFRPFNAQRDGTQEQTNEPSRICPCKNRIRRISKHKRNPRDASTEDGVLHGSRKSKENVLAQNGTTLCDDTLEIDDLFSREEVLSSDGTVSRDDIGHKIENLSRKESRSSAESRSDDGNASYAEIRTRGTPSQLSADTVLCNGGRWRETRRLSGETKRKDGNRKTGSSSNDGARPCDGTRSRDGCKSRDSSKSHDTYRSFDGPRSRDDATLETSSGASTEVSHSSSWKDQSAFTGHYYSTVHEWNSGEELTTEKMIKSMQSHATQGCFGNDSPRSTDSNIGSPKSEIVHRHEHHHYHYHIFKRS